MKSGDVDINTCHEQRFARLFRVGVRQYVFICAQAVGNTLEYPFTLFVGHVSPSLEGAVGGIDGVVQILC